MKSTKALASRFQTFIRLLIFGCSFLAFNHSQAQVSQEGLESVWRRIDSQIRLPISSGFAGIAGSEIEQKRVAEILDIASKLGLKAQSVSTTVTVPVTTRCEISINGKSIQAAPLYPNASATNTCEIDTPLVWLNAKPDWQHLKIKGSVAVMNFKCGASWQRAFELGAKAVIFIATGSIDKAEAEKKFLSVPVSLPRFLVTSPIESVPGNRASRVTIQCRQDWKQQKSNRIHITIPGRTQNSEKVIIGSYLDGMSIAPELGVSAEHSYSSSVALALLQYFAKNPPARALEFVFYSGHFLGLKGERQLVSDWLNTESGENRCVFTLDISGGSKRIGLFSHGSFYQFRPEARDQCRKMSSALRIQADFMARAWGLEAGNQICLDGINESDGKPSLSLAGTRLAIGAEPFVLANLCAATFATIDDARVNVESPFSPTRNEEESKQLQQNLLQQAKTIAGMIEFAGNQPTLPVDFKIPNSGIEFRVPQRSSLVAGFGTITGTVVRSDPGVSIFPNIPSQNSLVTVRRPIRSMAGVRGIIIEPSAPDGKYTLNGVPTVSSYWHENQPQTELYAHEFNAETGKIQAASGEFTSVGVAYSPILKMTSAVRSVPLVLFDCDISPIFQPIDPLELSLSPEIVAIDSKNFSSPPSIQIISPQEVNEPQIGVAFYPKDTRWTLLFKKFGQIRGIDQLPMESGDAGTRRANTLLQRSRELARPLDPFHLTGSNFLKWQASAENELANSGKVESGTKSWSAAQRVYSQAQSIRTDSTTGLLLYLALCAPFAFVVERLLFHCRSLILRLLVTAGIFMATALVLRLLHPAFLVVQSPIIIFVGFVMAGLSGFVSFYLIGKFDESLSETAFRPSGGIGTEIGLALTGMRRRPVQTLMTGLLVTVVTVCVMAFSSIKPDMEVQGQPSESSPQSTVVHKPNFVPLLENFKLDSALSKVYWRYGGEDPSPGVISIEHLGKRTEIQSLLALEPPESDPSKDSNWIDLPARAAKELSVTTGSLVMVSGEKLNVRRITTEESLRNQKELFPVDFPLSGINPFSSSSTTVERNWIRVSHEQVAVVSVETMQSLGGQARLLVGHLSPSKASNLAATTDLILESNGKKWFTQTALTGKGLGLIAIAIAVGIFFIINSLAASAIQRTSEIRVLSALGMSPKRISLIFVSESAIYAVLGSVTGYLLIQAVVRGIGNIPGLELNCSSTSTVFSTLFIIGACLVGAVIPSRISTKMVTSAQIHNWENLPSTSGEWKVALPFTVNESESSAMTEYLGTWLESCSSPASDRLVSSHILVEESQISAQVWLCPYDLGVSQRIQIGFAPTKLERIQAMTLQVEKISGDHQSWVQANQNFVVYLRQIILQWQTEESQIALSKA